MSINLTLFGQAITFALFIWFTMRFVWPPIIKALEDREKKIADGLSAAERGHYELERAHTQIEEELQTAKVKALAIINAAQTQAQTLIDTALIKAREEHEKLIHAAEIKILSQRVNVQKELRSEVANLSILCLQKILPQYISTEIDTTLINNILDKIPGS